MIPVHIPSRRKKCIQCDEPFDSGVSYHSILVEGETIERSDYCIPCWKDAMNTSVKLCSSWQGSVPEKREVESDVQECLDDLREAVQSDEEEKQMKAFFLALYLSRKKFVFPQCAR